MKDKKRGTPAVKQDVPQRLNKSKRQLNFNAIRIGNQRLIWKFNKDNPDLSFEEAGAVLSFVNWLQTNSYIIRRKN